MSGKGVILGLAGLGGVALLLRAASAGTTAKPSVQKTYVQTALDSASQSPTVAKAKGYAAQAKDYAAKGTAEAQAAINAVNNMLK